MSNTTPRRAGISGEEEALKLSFNGANRLSAVAMVHRSRQPSIEGVEMEGSVVIWAIDAISLTVIRG